MKRLLRISLLLLAAGLCPAAMIGCCKAQLKAQAEGIESATTEVFAEYEAIVIDGKPRPNFNDSDKAIRRNSLKKFKELVDQAKKE